MNEQIQEQLSALMDGELERDQTRFVLKRAAMDGELPLRWARYHVARHALRGQNLVPVSLGFAEGVMLRLERESMVHVRGANPWLRWGAGGAIAASVAVAALVLTTPAVNESVSTAATGVRGAAQMASIGTAPVAATSAPIHSASGEFRPPLLAPNAPVETAPASFGTDLVEPVLPDARMQSYLIRHYQATGAAGQSNSIPYVLLGTPQRETPMQPVRQNR